MGALDVYIRGQEDPSTVPVNNITVLAHKSLNFTHTKLIAMHTAIIALGALMAVTCAAAPAPGRNEGILFIQSLETSGNMFQLAANFMESSRIGTGFPRGHKKLSSSNASSFTAGTEIVLVLLATVRRTNVIPRVRNFNRWR